MKTLLLFTLFFTSIISINAQEPVFIVDSSAVNPWSNVNFANKPMDFNFAIVADNTGFCREGIFSTAIDYLNLMQPEFVISIGDLIEGNSFDENNLHAQWDEIDSIINKLEMPLIFIPGNHDNDNDVMKNVWKQRYGKSYYHFKYKDVLFLMLNSQDKEYGHISKEQIYYVKTTLERNVDVRYTFVFIHQPLWVSNRLNGWKDIEKLLSPIKHTVFCGHMHTYGIHKINNSNYITLATTGGGFVNPESAGSFDHITWVSMKNATPRTTIIELDGIHPHSFIEDKKLNLTEIELKEGVEISCFPISFKRKFTKGESVITVENNTDFEIMCSGNFERNDTLQIDFNELSFKLNPYDKKEIEFNVESNIGISTDTISPLLYTVTCTVQGKAAISKSINLQLIKK